MTVEEKAKIIIKDIKNEKGNLWCNFFLRCSPSDN